MRYVIYCRQSKDATGDGDAVARQEADCRKLCEQRGWTVTEVIVDNDFSASSAKVRPGFERMMKMAENRELDGIVCWHVDRLTRRLIELERIITVCENAKVKLATVSGDLDLSTDAGRLNARVLAAVARAEMERKSARQKLANEQRARQGKAVKWGKRPFGYTEGRNALVPEEADAIREACRILQTGGALRGIVRTWTEAGFRPPQGGAEGWTSQSVRWILSSPHIAGKSSYKGEVVGSGTWPAIVSEEIWLAVKAILDNPTRRPPQGTRALLSSLAECACGKHVWAGRSHRGRQVYKCSTYFNGPGAEGRHVSRSAEPADDFIRDLVIARLSREDAASLLLADDLPDAAELQDELLTKNNRLDELATAFADGDINRAQLAAGTSKLRAEISELESRLADTARVDVLGDLVRAQDVLAVWEGLDLDRQRAVIGVLMSVTLHPVGKGSRTFREDTVEIAWRS